MPERTERGEEDRKREDKAVQGEPMDANSRADTQTGTATRDKGVEPSEDRRREGHSEGK
ncbi:MAG: hypothetical protein JWO38_5812 [Gemmataceae bacterium]|nr:hypothetical protein [Gemmataceae bacterium]